LASKHSLSNGNEVEELTQLLTAFSQQNSMRIAIVLTAVGRMGIPRLNVIAVGMPACTLEEAAKRWGSPLFVSEVSDLVSLMGVAMRGMYGLDHVLAEEAFAKILRKDA
jgi:hypothetical protein